MDKIEASFELTKELYVKWCSNPVSKAAKKVKLTQNIINGVSLAVAITISLLSFIRADYPLGGLCVVLAIVFAYRLFLSTYFISLKYYKRARKLQNTPTWVRTFIFTDKILIKDANSTVDFKYSDMFDVSCDEETLYLFKDKQTIFRIPKNAFIKGTWEELFARLKEMLQKNE